MNIDGYDLRLTCSACPEQYDVFLKGAQVGYLRLRHGEFRADVPDCGGDTVYTASPNGDGEFFDDERDGYLRAAVAAIHAHFNPGRVRRIDPVDMERGETFAEEMHALACRLGPKEWSLAQRDAMATHLIEEAVKFARRGAPTVPAA